MTGLARRDRGRVPTSRGRPAGMGWGQRARTLVMWASAERDVALPCFAGAAVAPMDGRYCGFTRTWVACSYAYARPISVGSSQRPAMNDRLTGSGPTYCGGACYYASGWLVRPTQDDATWWHGGSLPGTTSILVRSYNNFSWVGLFNSRSLTANLEVESS